MKGAKIVRRRTVSGHEVRDGEIEASKAMSKTMKPADHPTGAELRRRRDLVWLYLASIGMTSPEIERACSLANRKQSVIRYRLMQARRHYERAGRG